jgi:hypothetical protein
MREFVNIKISEFACLRTKEIFARNLQYPCRFEIIKRMLNHSFKDDGFFIGEPMTLFGIDVYKNDLWSRALESWIPDNEFSLKD